MMQGDQGLPHRGAVRTPICFSYGGTPPPPPFRLKSYMGKGEIVCQFMNVSNDDQFFGWLQKSAHLFSAPVYEYKQKFYPFAIDKSITLFSYFLYIAFSLISTSNLV